MEGEIEFRSVNFSYPTRSDQMVLTDFSYKFEKGKTTAIVGPSGSGKSTIVQLIERFYDPNILIGDHKVDSNQILVDG